MSCKEKNRFLPSMFLICLSKSNSALVRMNFVLNRIKKKIILLEWMAIKTLPCNLSPQIALKSKKALGSDWRWWKVENESAPNVPQHNRVCVYLEAKASDITWIKRFAEAFADESQFQIMFCSTPSPPPPIKLVSLVKMISFNSRTSFRRSTEVAGLFAVSNHIFVIAAVFCPSRTILVLVHTAYIKKQIKKQIKKFIRFKPPFDNIACIT